MPRKCVDIRRQLGVDFSIVALEKGEEDSEFIKLIGGKTEGVYGRLMEEDDEFDPSSWPAIFKD